MMDVTPTCPLGHQCESVKGDTVYRCRWFIQMKGTDAMGQEHDEWGCAIAWMPVLQVEVASTSRGTSAAVESLRNVQTQRQDEAIRLIRGKNEAAIT